MENTVSQRINELINLKSKGQNDFERKMGLKRGALNGAVREGRTPHFDTVQVILSTFPDVSSDWLILGVGSMLKEVEINKMTILEQLVEQLREQLRKMESEIERYRKTQDALVSQLGKLKGTDTPVRVLIPSFVGKEAA